MIVYTVEKNLEEKEVVVSHNVQRMNGIPGSRHFECTPKTLNKSYYLNDEDDRIFLTEAEAVAAIEYGSKAE